MRHGNIGTFMVVAAYDLIVMALQCDPPHLGDIGDREPEPEVDPDFQYERQVEAKLSEENNANS